MITYFSIHILVTLLSSGYSPALIENAYSQPQAFNSMFQPEKVLALKKTVAPELTAPKGYRVVDRIGGDLNRDGIPDSILIVKSTEMGDRKSVV